MLVRTLKDCWDGVQGETEGIANKHASLAGNLLNDIAQAITQYVKQKEQERKRVRTLIVWHSVFELKARVNIAISISWSMKGED